MSYQDSNTIYQVLTQAKVIAVVGHSHKPQRPSYQIAQFLRRQGYTVYPVNPGHQEIEGYPCYASLSQVPAVIDVVNVFRRSEFLPAIVEEMLVLPPAATSPMKCLWTQLDIRGEAAAQRALAAGWQVVMDACIKVEYLRLGLGK